MLKTLTLQRELCPNDGFFRWIRGTIVPHAGDFGALTHSKLPRSGNFSGCAARLGASKTAFCRCAGISGVAETDATVMSDPKRMFDDNKIT